MRILFTGASSFSGMWFVKELASNGHSIVSIFRGSESSYTGLRKDRINLLKASSELVFDCPFGSEPFFKLVAKGPWDLFCHHAADVTNYKSPEFDVVAALANNTKNLPSVLKFLTVNGCSKILLTGSVFEQNEGEGTDKLRAVSPYGLSKGLTSEIFKYYTTIQNITLGKFVIPNPFGPYEESRFTTFLIQQWFQRKVASVTFPEYIRDNIPISLLAKAYGNFVKKIFATDNYIKCNPSWYRESQGKFTARFANEMRSRLGIPCEFHLHKQQEFNEPQERINTDILNPKELKWEESKSWDELALYYKKTYGN
jgi:UDP-glucose 4-epimerase